MKKFLLGALAALFLFAATPSEAQYQSGRTFFRLRVTNQLLLGDGSAASQTRVYPHSIQGGESKALTEGVATAVVQVAVPENGFTQFKIAWAVFADDTTNQQLVVGETIYGCLNEAGTEVCPAVNGHSDIDNTPTGTLTCADAIDNSPTDAVDFTLNCTSSLTQTTLDVYYRLDMLNIQTVTPQ